MNIGSIAIDYGNFPGLIITIMFIILQILTLLFVHNISWEYDLKEHIEKEKQYESEHTLLKKMTKNQTQHVEKT